MLAALIVVAVIAVLVILVLSAAIKVLREYERGVIFRLGRLLGAAQRAGPDLPHPDHRPDGQGRPADDHADDPAAGSDHEGQRARRA